MLFNLNNNSFMVVILTFNLFYKVTSLIHENQHLKQNKSLLSRNKKGIKVLKHIEDNLPNSALI